MLSEGDNPKEFLENTKLELFHDQVFCFTPKGALIALPGRTPSISPMRSTPSSATAASVAASTAAPLMTELENGDEIEIIRSKAQVSPPAAWEGFAVTGKARAAIRRATRNAVRNQYAGLGREIVERLLKAAGEAFDEKRSARCRASPALGRRRAAPRWAAARWPPATCCAPCIPTTRKSVPPRSRSSRSRRAAGSGSRRRSPSR